MTRERVRVLADTTGPSRTKQSFRGEADINAIMRKYAQTGVPPYIDPRRGRPLFGDFSNGLEFHEALTRVREAERTFSLIPAHVRSYVKNDVGNFLDLIYNPERRLECVKLGILPKEKGDDVGKGLERVAGRDSSSGGSRGAADEGARRDAEDSPDVSRSRGGSGSAASRNGGEGR